MRKKQNRINTEILTEAIIMILLILTMPIVYSKLTTISEDGIYSIENKNQESISKKIINFFDLIPTAKAQALYGCCKGTDSGACRLTTDQISCNEMSDGIGIWASGKKCEETDFCKPVCCMSDGSCQMNTPTWVCENNGGLINTDATCEITQCSKVCCEISGSTAYISGQQCDLFGGISDYAQGSTDFEKEINCMMKATQYTQGCCVSNTGCEYTNSNACSGTLYSKFCSQISDCNVQAKDGTMCYNGSVYYRDSDGNIEELKQNCPNLNLQCETQTDGSGKCVDMSCRDLILPNSTHITLQNMESMCVYDQKVPSLFSNTYDESWGQTAVGSRHWVWRCINGKVEIEGCEDYRAGICAQIDIDESSKVFNYAKCIPSLADACYGLQTQADCEDATKTGGGQCYWLGKDERIKNILGYITTEKDDNENYVGAGLVWRLCNDADTTFSVPGLGKIHPFCPNGVAPKLEQLEGFKQEDSEYGKSLSGSCMPKYPKADTFNEIPKYLYANVQVIVPQEKGETASGWPCKGNCEVGGYDDDSDNAGAINREQLWAELMSMKCSAVGDAGIKTNLAGAINIGVSEKSQCFENDDDTGDCSGDRESETEIIPSKSDLTYTWVSLLYSAQESLKNSEKIYSLENKNFDSQKNKFLGFTGAFLPVWTGIGNLKTFTSFKTFTSIVQAYTNTGFEAISLTGAVAMVAAAAIVAAALAYALGIAFGLSPAESLRLAKYAGAGAGIGMTLAIIAGTTGPVGWIVAGVGAVVAAVIAIFTGKDNRLFSYSFSCLPYSPPAGSANCELCNADPLRPCSEYRCWSLGADCVFNSTYGAGSDNEIVDGEGQCMAGNAGDMFPPTISKINPTSPFTLGNHQYTPTGTFMGSADISGTLYRFDYMTLNIKTNEKAICRWSYEATRFSNMPIGNGIDNLFPNKYQTDHTKTFSGTMVPIGENNLTIYIACTDTNGNENELPFKIFVGASSTDIVPPSITGTNPRNDAKKYTETGKVDVLIYLNEQVQGCKWSTTDMDYSLMPNLFNNCNTFVDGKISCNATLSFSGLIQDNLYYFRCNDTKGNANNYGYEYRLHPSGPLNITETSPTGTIESCSTLWNVTLSAKTDGGSEEGISICYYNNGSGILEQFDNTNSYDHSSLLTLPAGIGYNYQFLCIDESGNADQETMTFNIISNLNPPEVTRIYNEGSDLVIQTSKDAKCYYSKTNPGFTYSDTGVIPFLSEDDLVHRTGWINEVYYVKCQDLCGNGASLEDDATTIYPQDFE